LASEAKTVLESWVRYEGQVKVRQQKELAESVTAKINKELEDPKVLKRILDQSVADVESMYIGIMSRSDRLLIMVTRNPVSGKIDHFLRGGREVFVS